MLFKRFAHLAHIGCCKHIAGISGVVLIPELIVDGDYILYENDHHHKQFVNKAQGNGEYNHYDDADTAQPVSI